MTKKREHLPVDRAALERRLAGLEERLAGLEERGDLNAVRRLLLENLSVTVEGVIGTAKCLKVLERMGDSLADLQADMGIGLLPWIRRIAYEQIDPEMFVKFLGNGKLLRRLAALPLPDQQKIGRGEPLKVLLSGGDHRMVAVEDMTPEEFRQVFAPDRIRNDGEQATWQRAQEQKKPALKETIGDVVIEKKKGGITVTGPTFISRDMLLKILQSL